MTHVRIYGIYPDAQAAIAAVAELHENGYRKDEVKLIANHTLHEPIKDAQVVKIHDVDPTDDLEDYPEHGLYIKFFSKDEIEKDYADDKTLWERLKDTFTFSYPTKDEMALLRTHQEDLDQGKVIILVDETNKSENERYFDQNQKEL